MNIRLTAAQKVKVLNSGDAFNVMQKILLRANKIERDQEHFWVMGLATNNRILFVELVSIGSTHATIVEPSNAFRVALLKNAVKVIFTHNHPSGELNPSAADKHITDRLIQVGKLLEIKVIEHLIITPTAFLSFADTGLLQQLQYSTEWMPPFAIAKKIKEEQKITRTVEIATRLKQRGIDIQLIADVSGLSVKEVAKL